MSSTFSGISTALSSLIAQRQGLDISGQNLANANTVGYTRQRATLQSVGGTQIPAMFATSSLAGNGVLVTGVDRLADAFIDARLRT
ncbi:MAG: flagellar basal body protein, partial [Actinobacteria bacterium]|nr:flagellar basal body protein [Actinomycetota bacterium]